MTTMSLSICVFQYSGTFFVSTHFVKTLSTSIHSSYYSESVAPASALVSRTDCSST